MARYQATIVETRTVQVIYTVEADSEDEAREKLENGETEDELELSNSAEVLNRTLYTQPSLTPNQKNVCGECGDEADEIIGCPDGAELCRACFDKGNH